MFRLIYHVFGVWCLKLVWGVKNLKKNGWGGNFWGSAWCPSLGSLAAPWGNPLADYSSWKALVAYPGVGSIKRLGALLTLDGMLVQIGQAFQLHGLHTLYFLANFGDTVFEEGLNLRTDTFPKNVQSNF
jgi:hypothetical protein